MFTCSASSPGHASYPSSPALSRSSNGDQKPSQHPRKLAGSAPYGTTTGKCGSASWLRLGMFRSARVSRCEIKNNNHKNTQNGTLSLRPPVSTASALLSFYADPSWSLFWSPRSSRCPSVAIPPRRRVELTTYRCWLVEAARTEPGRISEGGGRERADAQRCWMQGRHKSF